MDSNSYQSLTEAYQSIYSSQENLEEQGGYLGFSVGRGKKSVTGSFTDKSGNTFGGEVGRVQSKDTDAAARATTTNALSKLQDTQRKSSTAPKPATSLASKTSSVKPGATGASALGGPLSLSAADKAPRTAAGPKIDKVPEVQTKKANYFIPNVQLAKPVDKNAPTKVDPTSAKPKPKPKPNKTNTTPRPTDKPVTPTKVDPTSAKPKPEPNKTNITPRPTDRAVTPTPTPAPTPRVANTTPITPKVSPTPRVANTTPTVASNRQRQVASYEMDTYNLVLEYLLDEGFASTEQSADKIILNMSEAWFADIVELYKGKHGQSEEEYMDSRSDAGKQISGDSKQSGAAYSHRSFRGQGKPAKPGERQTAQGKMTNADRTELMIRKNALRKEAEAKALKKEEAEYVDENRRAARSAGGYKDDSKKQTDPSKDGFTGIGNMTIKDIMALNKKIEARTKKEEFELWVNSLLDEGYDLSEYTWDEMYDIFVEAAPIPRTDVRYDKHMKRMVPTGGVPVPRASKKPTTQMAGYEPEGENIDEGREEDAKKSLDAVKKRQGVLDDHEKKTGKKLDITKTPEYKSHKQNFPGAKRTGKKERGAKETPDETHRRRVNKTVDRIVKKGYTSKEKKEVESMAKHTSPRD